MKYALGLVEAIGLATAYEAADAAVKAANIELLGLEPCRGDGMHTIKILGDVGAVKAAVAAAQAACAKGRGCFSVDIIARPADLLEPLVHNQATIGAHSPKTQLPSVVLEDWQKYNPVEETVDQEVAEHDVVQEELLVENEFPAGEDVLAAEEAVVNEASEHSDIAAEETE